MKKMILLIGIAIAGAVHAGAQSVGPSTLNAAGGGGTIAGNTFDWSVGELTMVSTFSTPGIEVTQGVLQPPESTVGIPKTTSVAKQIRVFPNPASTVVNIEYTSATDAALTYRLMDMTGKVISTQKVNVTSGITTAHVSMQEVACASYMLEVTVDSGVKSESTSYQIQKIR